MGCGLLRREDQPAFVELLPYAEAFDQGHHSVIGVGSEGGQGGPVEALGSRVLTRSSRPAPNPQDRDILRFRSSPS